MVPRETIYGVWHLFNGGGHGLGTLNNRGANTTSGLQSNPLTVEVTALEKRVAKLEVQASVKNALPNGGNDKTMKSIVFCK